MPASILLTKLYKPAPRPDIVPRPRLVDRLNEGLKAGRKLTLISAPAGFGKTSLVSEWIAHHKRPIAWLSLDEGDNELVRFLGYLIAALQTVERDVGNAAMEMIQGPQPPPTTVLLTSLLNEITHIPDKFVLVLDDYHVIESKTVGDTVNFLVEHSPPQMHVVIATREDPPLPLARFRARSQMTELRAADLRFTPAEAAEFLNQVMHLQLSSGDIAALESRTEGWIAGLQLAALSMQGQQDVTGFIQSFTGSHHFVLDYLIEEVLQQQSEGLQAFLLRTSILKRLCGPLCDAILKNSTASGQEALENLERANLFIVPLDSDRCWYRYHHLFGDILRQRLGQSLSAEEIAEHHLRASLWYEMNGDSAEAFHHAYAAGDLGRAAGLAEAAWQGMENRFQTATWLGWAKKLPEHATRVRPVLSTQIAQAFIDAGEPETSEVYLRNAEQCLNGSFGEMVVADETQLAPLPGLIAMTRAYNAQVQGDLSGTVKYAKLALQHIPADDHFRRAQATITLEVTHWTRGDLEAARAAMVDWMNSLQKAGNFAFHVASAFALADIQVAQGHLHEAARTYQQSLELASMHGEDTQRITAHHYLGLAMLKHEMGEDTAATEYLHKAEEIGAKTTMVDWSYRWHIAQARLKESEGNWEAALILLDEAGRRYVKTLIPDIRPTEALKAKVFLKQGRLDKAANWVIMRKLSPDDEISYLNEFEHLTFVRVLLAEHPIDRAKRSIIQANGLLERLLKAAEAQRRTGSVIEILVTQALAHQVQGSLPLALASLERAVTLAEPEGFFRLFVDEGEPMRLLLLDFRAKIEKQASSQGHPRLVYVERLLSGFKRIEERHPMTPPQRVNLVEALSEREMEVLKLLRTELSGPEIAGQLVISPNTFRTHTKNIFAKLGVNNRRAAVRRAEELDLI